MLRTLRLGFSVPTLCAAVWLSQSSTAHVGSARARAKMDASGLTLVRSTPSPLSGMTEHEGQVLIRAIGGGAYPADLPPGAYGTVRLEPGAEIVLSSGDYFIEALEVGAGATVWLDAFDVTGDDRIDSVRVRVTRRLDVAEGAELAILDPTVTSTRHIEITVLQRNHLTIPSNAVVRGTLLAPQAKVTFREGSRLEGAVYADRVRLDPGVVVVYHEPSREE